MATIRAIAIMAVHDLFSKRHKRLSGQVQDNLRYDLPEKLRVQVLHIWEEAFGRSPNSPGVTTMVDKAFLPVGRILAKEHGLRDIGSGQPREAFYKFFTRAETHMALDALELAFQTLNSRLWSNSESTPAQAIDELNHRFRENGVGYQFEGNRLMRMDSQFLHAEVVKHTLTVLTDPRFAGANDEFLKAHEHYRHGLYKETLNEALKAFESTLKSICTIRGWPFQPTATAKQLLETVFAQGLISGMLQSHFSALRTTLESGLPTIRNKQGGHGQGATPTVVPESLAGYALHLAATNILYLVDAEKELP